MLGNIRRMLFSQEVKLQWLRSHGGFKEVLWNLSLVLKKMRQGLKLDEKVKFVK